MTALEGVRIVDLTRVWAGPLGTRILADLGAEVIKVEDLVARGPKRVQQISSLAATFFPGGNPGDRPWNRNAAFNKLHRNKLSLTLNLKQPTARDALLRLVAVSDVVIENYSPRVMASLGLGYPDLCAAKPGIILVSMPGYGLDGPLRDRVAYGTTLDGESGLCSLTGDAQTGPLRIGVAFPDPVAGVHAAGAVLTALHHRERTGEGQHVDLSQLESMISYLGPALVATQLAGEPPQPTGNRDPRFAPHGCYPCRAPDTWVSIAARDDAEWAALAAVLGGEAKDARYATLENRRSHQDELDAAITAWTRGRTPAEAMTTLQAAGVCAGAVLDAAGLAHDPHLEARGFLVELTHPDAGTHRYAGQPIRFSGTPVVMRSDGPRLGEHNHYVLRQLLGMSEAEVGSLESTGVIGQEPSI